MNTKDYKKCAELVRDIALEFGDERASKCGYDLLNGMANGSFKKRFNAWVDYLKEGKNGSHTDEQIDNDQPAIIYTNGTQYWCRNKVWYRTYD